MMFYHFDRTRMAGQSQRKFILVEPAGRRLTEGIFLLDFPAIYEP
jgi:hypothetical protein